MNILITTNGPSRMVRVQSLRLLSHGLISTLSTGELQFSGRLVVLLLHRHCSLSQKGPQGRKRHIHRKRNARIVPSSPSRGAQHIPSRKHVLFVGVLLLNAENRPRSLLLKIVHTRIPIFEVLPGRFIVCIASFVVRFWMRLRWSSKRLGRQPQRKSSMHHSIGSRSLNGWLKTPKMGIPLKC